MGERVAMCYECYGGPLDGTTVPQLDGEWWWAVPSVASGYYHLAGLSAARGKDMGHHWFWRPGTTHPRPTAPTPEVPHGE